MKLWTSRIPGSPRFVATDLHVLVCTDLAQRGIDLPNCQCGDLGELGFGEEDDGLGVGLYGWFWICGVRFFRNYLFKIPVYNHLLDGARTLVNNWR